ncbi:WD40 repeat-like protein [Neolentinus lepideus HHB14362 ss-1]|uniref:WD40 repeat-like protein n=1 Tax=Neolentinus lepideus HHB14362 ss-1 TaxID=1314782 RepID=A0A165QL14_9AGAM|nr:WD40 repeat-like protein [Neolentinus lepideus HHB14362 ss-1]
MVVHTDKRILWDPRAGSKFIVGGGSTITLYECTPDSSEIRHVTSQSDLQFMKCFQWSPDPAVEDLIAVGLNTGTVDLMRLESTKHASNHVLTSGPRVSLPVRNSRPCNTLAFCDAQPNYLAVGLDKVRNDPSLIIWDISTARSMLSMDPIVDHASNVDSSNGRSQPSLPRSELNARGDARILQQHSPTDYISSVEFVPNSWYLLLAGISHRWLRLFDLRSPVPGAHTNVPSKVHSIATDPTDPYRIATFGDSVVTVWDSRRISQPLLTFTTKDASADGGKVMPGAVFTTMQFSSTRRGRLATLEKSSAHVRFWDLQHAQVTETTSERSKDPAGHPNRTPRLSWASPSSMLSWSSSGGSPTAAEEYWKYPSNVVLADTRKTKDFNWSLSSFALVPSLQKHPLASHVMVVSKEGDLELYEVSDTPKYISWSSRGDLAIGYGRSCRTVSGFDVRGSLNSLEPWNVEVADGLPVVSAEDAAVQAYLLNGRRKSTTPAPPFFGRGDEDGFPALSSTPSRSRERGALRVPRNSAAPSPAVKTVNLSADHSTSTVKASDFPASAVSRPRSVAGSSVRHSRRDKSASKARRYAADTVHKFVEQDISMVMRRRVLRGYGLTNAYHNHIITQDDLPGSDVLSDLWAWISFSRDILSAQTLKHFGLDLSYEGLSGVWDSSPKTPSPNTPEDLQSALQSPMVSISSLSSPNLSVLGLEYPLHRTTSRSKHLKARSHTSSSSGEPPVAFSAGNGRATVQTAKSEQRELALQMCGWQVAPEDFANEIRRWEREGKHSKAACWLVFTGQYSKALEVLMRSKDETHYMMTGTLVALTSHGAASSSRSSELREHTEHLIVRLQDPYFRAMLTLLTLRDWSEVLEEEALPLRERLVVAFQFLDDKALSSYLRRMADRAVSHGDIEGLVITGLTKAGMDVLQNYVDSTGDVQSAAILSAYVCPAKLRDKRAEMWLEAYRDMLDGWRLFHHRCQLDIDRGEIIKRAVEEGNMVPGWAPRQIMLRCNYCSKPVDVMDPAAHYKGRTTSCPSCGRALPRCSICLMTLSVVPDGHRENNRRYTDTIDDAIVICQNCRHGGHASHLLEWFYGDGGDAARAHQTCPVADCGCRCTDEL